jgi:hypothetical protein
MLKVSSGRIVILYNELAKVYETKLDHLEAVTEQNISMDIPNRNDKREGNTYASDSQFWSSRAASSRTHPAGWPVSRIEFRLLCTTLNCECLTLEVVDRRSLRFFEHLEQVDSISKPVYISAKEALRTSCSILLRLSPLVAFAFAMRSLTPTSCPSTYYIPVIIKPLIAFLICFLTRVASSLKFL